MKGKINKNIQKLQLETFKMLTGSPSLRLILRGIGVTFVIIFGTDFTKQPHVFSINFVMIILGFFLIFTPYIFKNFKKFN
ncbi:MULTISPECIES: hypothetical protein [Bacillus cereus group]|uniref:Uncharacterized protein n=1 Tax=Bacillus thuringiensis serovar mexicanensis TaxID=180868 RepID=A0A242VZI5_BACTU|nr:MULTISPECIES: hypothetical protein [Bacillus cereus group]EEM59823.1 hypothetical protein bthur0007_22730 [Bacillus thuringiensis serovar monterrey BGSC 4AJ1]MEB9670197.1 hypothetical protein [Bacillus anthracis]OTW44586.1 hypothetical protein BK699_30865 [Bacillus thuringiensis serovar mexicanensis]OTW98741.1 hypothetical protein BK705_22990 [Bacillus thuringiensis serovar monterrey]PHD42079.1 hypothetical protein COF67_29025 [Bacillus toyonensis]